MSKIVGVTVGSPLSKEKIIELIKEHSGENLTAKEVSELLTAAQRELIGTSDDPAAKDTIKGAKAYAAEMYAGSNEYTANKVKAAKKEIIGFSDDEETANTINGAKNYAKKLLESLDGEKGDSGIFVGSGEMPEDATIQIILDGDEDGGSTENNNVEEILTTLEAIGLISLVRADENTVYTDKNDNVLVF